MENKSENRRSKTNFIGRLSSSLEMSTKRLLGKSLGEITKEDTKTSASGILNEGYDYDVNNQLSENSIESGNEGTQTAWSTERLKRNTGIIERKLTKKEMTIAEKPMENEKQILTSSENFDDNTPPRNNPHSSMAKLRSFDGKMQKLPGKMHKLPEKMRKFSLGPQKTSSSISDESVLNVWTAPPSRLSLLKSVEGSQDDIPELSDSTVKPHRLKRRLKQEKTVEKSTEESSFYDTVPEMDDENKLTEKPKPRIRRKTIKEEFEVKTKLDLTIPATESTSESVEKIIPRPETKVKKKKKQRQTQGEELEKKTIKMKKKKSLSETTLPADSQISGSVGIESTDPSQVEEVLGVLIHRLDGIKMHFFISHPVVQVHLFDLNTGRYVNKSNELKSVISYYESENTNIKHILPVMTQPYEMKGKQILTPEWQELLIFNESFEYFVGDSPRVVIFFEILDFVSMTQASKDCHYLCLEGGWYRIAWAFLKLLGAGDVKNTGKKVQLQLYYPPKKGWNFLRKKNEHDRLFGWWNNKRKKKYPYTLYVTVKGICVPDVAPALRSMIPTQQERGKTTFEDFERTLLGVESTESEKILIAKQSEKQFEIRWTRVPGQLCKIPNKKLHSIHVGRRGCFVAKFSHSGRYLACSSCDDGEMNSIVVFEILSAKLKYKFTSHFGLIYQIKWSSDDKNLLSSSADCTTRIWSLEPYKEKTSKILPHPSYVYSSAYHPHVPNIVVSGCYDHAIRVWDVSKPDSELIQELYQHTNMVNAVCFDEDGDSLFTGDGSGIICRWNVYVTRQPNRPASTRDWTLNQEIKCNELKNKVINDIILHPSGRKIFVSTRDSCIRLIDTRQFTLIQRFQGHVNVLDFIHISVTPCGSYLFSGSEDACVYVWNTNTGAKVHTYADLRCNKTVNSVDYHPHEHMFACSAFVESAPVQIFKFESSTEEISFYPTSPVVADDLKIEAQRRPASGGEMVADLKPEMKTIPKAKQRKSKELVKPERMLPHISSSTSILKSSTSSDKNRSVTFQDEIETSTSSKWKIVMDKLDSILEKSSSCTSDTYTTTTSKSKIFTDTDISSLTSTSTSAFTRTSTLTVTPTLTPSSTSTPTLTQLSTSTQDEFKVVSLYTFCASNDGELSLKPGDVIKVIGQINNHWWEGTSKNGIRGIFPSNYVHRVETDFTSSTSTPVPVPRRRRKTHAVPSVRGTPIYFSASEDDLQ